MLQLQSISKTFNAGAGQCRATVRALDSISLTVSGGQVVIVRGAPAAGKSTLLRCAAGLLTPDAGSRHCPTDAPSAVHSWPGPHDWRRAGVRATTHAPAVHLFDEPIFDSLAGERAQFAALLRRLTLARHSVLIATSLPFRDFVAVLPPHARFYRLAQGRLHAAGAASRAVSLAAESAEHRASIFG